MKDSRTKEDIYRKFQNPTREYRGTPFWSWNAEMTPEEVRRQVRELYEQGVGGFFIHSRDGLETPYLGREWMDCVEAAVDEGHEIVAEGCVQAGCGWSRKTASSRGRSTACQALQHAGRAVCSASRSIPVSRRTASSISPSPSLAYILPTTFESVRNRAESRPYFPPWTSVSARAHTTTTREWSVPERRPTTRGIAK